MKRLANLKLTHLSNREFEMKKQEMSTLKGGTYYSDCACVCWGSSYPTAQYPVSSHSNIAY